MIERVQKLEKAVQQLGRRAPGRVVAIAPPTVVSFYAAHPAEDGTLCSFVSPFKATVKTIAFSMQDSQLAKDAEVEILYVGTLTASMKVPLKYFRFVEDVDYAVDVGDTVTIKVNHQDMIQKVSISIVLELADRTVAQIKLRLREIEDA